MSLFDQLGADGAVVFAVGVLFGALVARVIDRGRAARLGERLRLHERETDALRATATERDALRERVAVLEARRAADLERIAWIHTADEQVRSSFDTLASKALKQNTDHLIARSDRQLGRLRDDMAQRIAQLDGELHALEVARADAYAGLRQEVSLLRAAHQELNASAAGLVTALRSPTVRGRWGETHLRRVVELAGMAEHVDFSLQPTLGGQRPDMVVHLPGGGSLPIDAKTPLEAYLDAAAAPEDALRAERLDAHVRAVRQHVAELASRSYWKQLTDAPEAVVLYMPNEAALAAALERDPTLLEDALAKRVLPTSPVTLLALLKTVAFGWQQQRIASGARAIADTGKTLHERVARFVQHLDRTGKGLDQAVQAFNVAVGALETRVLPAARRLQEAGAIADKIESVESVARRARRPAAQEEAPRADGDQASGEGREATRTT